MKSKLRRILPHVAIVLCNMYIVFFLIDRVNTAMQFINNSITKALLLILSVISTVNAAFLIQDERSKDAARSRRQGAPGNRAAGARNTQGARSAKGAAAAQAVRASAPRGAASRSAGAHSSASGQRQASRSASGREGAR